MDRTGADMSVAEDRKRDGCRPEEGPAGPVAGDVVLTGEAQLAIARGLRQTYHAMLEEPIPDKFARLLAALGRAENTK